MLTESILQARIDNKESIVDYQIELIRQLTSEAQKFIQLVGLFSGLLLTSISLFLSDSTGDFSFDAVTLSIVSAVFLLLILAFVKATQGYAYGRDVGYGLGSAPSEVNNDLSQFRQIKLASLNYSIEHNDGLVSRKAKYLSSCLNYFASVVVTSVVAIYSIFFGHQASLYLAPIAILTRIGMLLFMARTNKNIRETQKDQEDIRSTYEDVPWTDLQDES